MDADVIVAGAGPAGCTVARICAGAGLETIIIDRATFPREKPCAGALSPRAAADLRRLFGLVDAMPALGVPRYGLRAIYYRPAGGGGTDWSGYRHLRLESDRPLAFVTRRAALDAFLLERAKEAGATVLMGTEVTSWGHDAEKTWVATREAGVPPKARRPALVRILESRFLVGADGAASVVARGLRAGVSLPHGGLSRPDRGPPCARRGPTASCLSLFFPLGAEEAERATLGNLDFLFGLVRGGFGWAFPGAEGLAVGVGALVRAGWPRPDLGEALERLLDLYGLEPGPLGAPAPRSGATARGTTSPEIARPAGWPVPLGGSRRVWGEGRVLLVGDAAGVANPLTGEGIGPAVWSAELAARVIAGRAGAAPDSAVRRAAGKLGPNGARGDGGAARAAAAFGAGEAGGAADYGRSLWSSAVGPQRPRLWAATMAAGLSAERQALLFRRGVFSWLRGEMPAGGRRGRPARPARSARRRPPRPRR